VTAQPFLLVEGALQRSQGAINVAARRLVPLRGVREVTRAVKSHDFH